MFLACFSVAEVMVVSMVAVLGRALVMVVSCWPTSAVAEVSLVSTSPRGCVLCAKKFFLQAQNGRKMLFSGVLGEFFRGGTAGGAVLGELCRVGCWIRLVLGEFCPPRPAALGMRVKGQKVCPESRIFTD